MEGRDVRGAFVKRAEAGPERRLRRLAARRRFVDMGERLSLINHAHAAKL